MIFNSTYECIKDYASIHLIVVVVVVVIVVCICTQKKNSHFNYYSAILLLGKKRVGFQFAC